MRTHTHESYAGSTFNTLGVSASGVSTVTLESVGLLSDEWISLIEVGDALCCALHYCDVDPQFFFSTPSRME